MSQGTRHCLVSQGGYHTVIESEEKTLFSKSGGYIGMRQGLVSGNKIFFFPFTKLPFVRFYKLVWKTHLGAL